MALIWPAKTGADWVESKGINLTAFSMIEARKLNVIVAVIHRTGNHSVREFGSLRQDGLEPEATLVDLGSITKTVTAIAVLKLVEQDKLKLGDTLARFWPETPRDKAQITVHQLLTHTSGLPEDVGEDEEPLQRSDFITRVLAEDLVGTPGKRFSYSNAGYGMLAAIVELRSKVSFEDYLEHHLLRPNGLGSMGYAKSYRNNESLRTPSGDHSSTPGRTILDASWGGHPPGWNLVGNGGLVSTPADFLRFWRAVRRELIVGKELLKLVLEPHVPELERQHSSYGYGLFVRDMPDHGRIYGHDGGNDVFTAEWTEFPDAGVIVFTAGLGEDAIEAMELILEHDRFPDRH